MTPLASPGSRQQGQYVRQTLSDSAAALPGPGVKKEDFFLFFSGTYRNSLELNSGPGRKAEGILGRGLVCARSRDVGLMQVSSGKSNQEMAPYGVTPCSPAPRPTPALESFAWTGGLLGVAL